MKKISEQGSEKLMGLLFIAISYVELFRILFKQPDQANVAIISFYNISNTTDKTEITICSASFAVVCGGLMYPFICPDVNTLLRLKGFWCGFAFRVLVIVEP
jgi:hypothetical protein